MLNCSVVTAGETGTCKMHSGFSLIDYALIDSDIRGIVESLEQVGDVPWKPHVGLQLKINRRPEGIITKQLIRPKPLPKNVDEKGEAKQWHITNRDWQNYLHNYTKKAQNYVQDQCHQDNLAWNHAWNHALALHEHFQYY